MNRISALIPFDQARLYFLNDNGDVYDEYLLGIDKQTAWEYHEHYSRVDNGAYSVAKKAREFQNHYPSVEDCIYDWSKYGPEEEFFKEYVRPNQIRHSFGLGLRDLHNTLKCMFSLERVRDIKYSEAEIAIMSQIRAHLDNLYQNFYVPVPGGNDTMKNKIMEDSRLTSREAEIAELLTRGVTPVHISEKLYISTTTVKKHIANIHGKLNVSTRQELIVKLLGR
jgi:DNA-binding CsgD family transcriptional regulator